MREASYLLCNILGKQTDPDWRPDPVSLEMTAAVLAAAEERGRRRGVEEAAKECELRIASWGRLSDQPTVAARVDEAESLAEIIRCLAPRDSGKEEP